MDVASLLNGFRPSDEAAVLRKTLALYAAREALLRSEPALDFEGHLVDHCRDIIGNIFGGAATDAHFTTVLTLFRRHYPNLDPLVASVLNSIVLEMNFQTRLSIDGVMGASEAVLFSGAAEQFAFAMLHGNHTFGLHITDESGAPVPEWTDAFPELEYHGPHVIRTIADNVTDYLRAGGRDRIGAILMADGAGEDFDISERYAAVADSVSRHTIYCLCSAAETVLATAHALAKAYPMAVSRTRLYSLSADAAYERRGILLFHGLDTLPVLPVKAGITKDFYILGPAPKDGSRTDIEVVSYHDGDTLVIDEGQVGEIGRWEPSPLAKPWLISSSAPLPDEARSRISDDTDVYHSMVGLRNGMLIPSRDSSHATYIHAASDGGIVTDYGDEGRNIFGSKIFRNTTADADGILRAKYHPERILYVNGDAMPLTFTPILHRWHSHFVIQCLPRVQILRNLKSDASLIVPDTLRAKQLEMLEVLGFGPDRVVKVPEDGAIVQADRLLVVRAWRLAFTESTTRIYQDIVDHFGCDRSAPRRRILISRESRKSWRNLLNYETVRLLLTEKYGFEEVAPEKLTLEEEVRLYNEAEIVVGAEGAGLYGGTFASPGAIFLSICDEDYIMPILATLAKQRGFRVGYVFGESLRADADLDRRLPWGHSDFVIDPARVEKAVQAALRQLDKDRGIR